jgi:hypothetical protein
MYVYVCMYVCVCDPYYGEGVLEYLLHLVDATDRLRGEALAVAADHAHAGAAVGEAGEENIIYIYIWLKQRVYGCVCIPSLTSSLG